MDIPDNGSQYVSSTIDISGAPAGATVTGIDCYFSAVHPYEGDLIIDLNADPTGSLGNVHLWNREGGSADNPSRTVTGITTYDGLTVNRTWYLYALDAAPGDVGYITQWWIRVYYATPDITGTLNVKAEDSSGALRSNATVVLYDSTFSTRFSTGTTDLTGFLSFGSLAAADYNLELYAPNGDFWNSQLVHVYANQSNDFTLKQDRPYEFNLQVYDDGSNSPVTGGSIPLGTALRYEVSVANDTAVDQAVRARLWSGTDSATADPFGDQDFTIPAHGTHVFVYRSTPAITGRFGARIQVQDYVNSQYTPTDTVPWANVVTVTQPTGQVAVTVDDHNGQPSTSGPRVLLYDSSFTSEITSTTAGSDGQALLSNLVSGTYGLRAYGSNGDFWCDGSASIVQGITTYVILRRDRPYAAGIHVYNNDTGDEVTGAAVTLGTPLRIDVSVENDTSSEEAVQVSLFDDPDPTSDASTVSGTLSGHSSGVFHFPSPFPPVAGTFSRYVRVSTETTGGYVPTDSFSLSGTVTTQQPAITITSPLPGTTFAMSAEPAMPQVTATADLAGLPSAIVANTQFSWNASILYDTDWAPLDIRPMTRQVIAYPTPDDPPLTITTTGLQPVTFTFPKLRGGSLTITVSAQVTGQILTAQSDGLKIVGTNPTADQIRAALPNDILRMIAKQESGDAQFYGPQSTDPYWSKDHLGGVGIMQITVPAPTPDQIWNWKANILAGIDKFNTAIYFAQNYAAQLQATPAWKQLVDEYTRLSGNSRRVRPPKIVPAAFTTRDFSASDRSQLTLDAIRGYNGFGGKDSFGLVQHEFRLHLVNGHITSDILTYNPVRNAYEVSWEEIPENERIGVGDPYYVTNVLKQVP